MRVPGGSVSPGMQLCGIPVRACVLQGLGGHSVCCSQVFFQKLHSMAGEGGVFGSVCVPCGHGLRAPGILCVHRDSTCKLFPCEVIGGEMGSTASGIPFPREQK